LEAVGKVKVEVEWRARTVGGVRLEAVRRKVEVEVEQEASCESCWRLEV